MDCFLLAGRVNEVRDGDSFSPSVYLFGGERGTEVLDGYVLVLLYEVLYFYYSIHK